jgi:hypothetical protein
MWHLFRTTIHNDNFGPTNPKDYCVAATNVTPLQPKMNRRSRLSTRWLLHISHYYLSLTSFWKNILKTEHNSIWYFWCIQCSTVIDTRILLETSDNFSLLTHYAKLFLFNNILHTFSDGFASNVSLHRSLQLVTCWLLLHRSRRWVNRK